MQYTLTQTQASTIACDCIILGVYENAPFTDLTQKIDAISQAYLSKLHQQGDISGKRGQTLLLHNVPGITAARILFVGLGQKGELTAKQFGQLIKQSFNLLQSTGTQTIACYLTEVEVKQLSTRCKVRQIIEQAEYSQYRFNHLKTHPIAPCKYQHIMIYGENSYADAISEGVAIGKGVNFTRELGNLPPNICTPTYLAEQALIMAKNYNNLEAEILDQNKIAELGMGALLAVAQGSRTPPKFIILNYKGTTTSAAPILLVGKGVTFDTGGICIKPRENMDEMKFDMCGAASIFGAMLALAELKLPLNVVGLIPAVENMPDGLAYRPGDIIKSMSGQTIEITNTDAEGRLILCDALTYAARYRPSAVIDLATLTGAMVIALGFHTTGLFSNCDKLADEILTAAKQSNDPTWQLPYNEQYQEALNSNFADMVNAAGRDAGSITAACFLSRFIDNYPWAHLDIAGTSFISGKDKGATGRPVALLVQFLINRIQQNN